MLRHPPRSGAGRLAAACGILTHRSYNRGVAELLNYLRGDQRGGTSCPGAGPMRLHKFR